MKSTVDQQSVTAEQDGKQALEQLAALLQQGGGLRLVNEQGGEAALPASVVEVLQQAANQLVKGRIVTITTYSPILTTQTAADLLNVSRPYLIKLLDEGAIPYTTTLGTHRRIAYADVMCYKEKRDAERVEGLAEMTRLAQEMGFYSK